MIELIGVRASSHCLHVGDELFVECTFKALSDRPISEKAELFCDFMFGHMTLPAGMPNKYRVSTEMYPQPALWEKGDIVTVGTRWKIPNGIYGGSFGINVGICNSEAVPINFTAQGKIVNRFYAGDIQAAFEGCAPKFVNSHRQEIYFGISEDKETVRKNESPKLLSTAEAVLRDRKSDTLISVMLADDNGHYSCDYVSFNINTEKKGNLTCITLAEVCEKDGCELLDVKLPNFVAKANAQLITSFMGGRKADPTKAFAWGYEQRYEKRNVAVLESEGEIYAIETPYLDDKLHHSIFGFNGLRYASVGATFTYRLRMYGDNESIRVINVPTMYIYSANTMSGILEYLRRGLKKRSHMYDRGLFYYFQIECDGFDEVRTFSDALQRVKDLYEITGGAKQVMLLRGWQHQGHDTGYPDVFTVNKKAGSLEDLKYLISEARKYNAIVTFHDNYDDMYEENGYFDGDIAARNSHGEYMTSWIWVSGISVLTSFPKLIKSGKMQKRVKKTLEMYPVKDSYHLDVLSCEVRRYDFSPEISMAAQEVVEYKKAVIKEFEKYGFTITSEAVSQPFANLIGHAWSLGYLPDWLRLFSCEESYPLMPMIYHGFLGYSESDQWYSVVSGAEIVPGITGGLGNYKEVYYLKTLPIGLLCNCTLDDYKYENGEYITRYSDGTVIRLNGDDIEIKNGERYLTKDGNTLVDGYEKGEYIGYTKCGTFKMRKYFDGEIAEVRETGGENGNMSYRLENGDICIEAKGNTAFKISIKEQ